MSKKTEKLPQYLTKKEVENLIKKVRRDRHKMGIYLMSYAGLRVSEMTGLRVEDINLARGYLRVTGKGNKTRIVPINPPLEKQIEHYLKKYSHKLKPESLLVGGDRTAWYRAVKKYSILHLGNPAVSCHTLRHSFATILYDRGVSIERISQLLGHSRIDTTMIYSHISMEKKKEAVNVMEEGPHRLVRFILPRRTRDEMTVKHTDRLIGREKELSDIMEHLKNNISVIVIGPRGSGKSAILKNIKDVIYIEEYMKKKTLIRILLSTETVTDEEVRREAEKELRKLTVDQLADQIQNMPRVIVIDDITEVSRPDKKLISKLSRQTLLITSSSKQSDKKLFRTYVEIKPLRRHHTRIILSDMISMTDPEKKERVVDDILHTAGDNLREAEYIAGQLQLGKTTEEVTTEERENNQVSIAPVLLIFVLFFLAYVLKSYAPTMIAFSYALLLIFRIVFIRFIFGASITSGGKK